MQNEKCTADTNATIQGAHVYAGMFLIAFSTLALEITLTRLLSVITWYHLAFFAISTAMLGMTAGATTVYLKPDWFTQDRLNNNIGRACLGYSLVVPFSLILLCLIPITLHKTVMSLLALLLATFACALPFYFSGISITSVLTKHQLPIGKLYASDLVGASLGCLFVLGGLEFMDAPSVILLCASIGVLAALAFTWREQGFSLRRPAKYVFVILVLSALANSATSFGIRPFAVKGRLEVASDYLVERWNSFSRVVVHKVSNGKPQYWGPSPKAPQDQQLSQHVMIIDGEAGTTLRRFSSNDDIDHLRFDVVNVAYYLRPKGGACVIGVGGGRDLQSALLFGHEKVVGVEVNPIFVELLTGRMRTFAGLADDKRVTLVVDEARSYLSRAATRYSVIQMSLTDTWAGTGAGAFSLSENALYTVEAWQVFLGRLAEDGIFTVSRWHSQADVGETGRLISLAVASLLRAGIQNPSAHIALVTTARDSSRGVSTLLIGRKPFTPADIAELKDVVSDLEFSLEIVPGSSPRNDALRDIVSANSVAELDRAISGKSLNYQAPTDENPYFFNMLRLGHIGAAFRSDTGVISGNLLATLTLAGLILSLSVLTLVTIVFPLLLRGRAERIAGRTVGVLWYEAAYFSLIGAGFMFAEIALIQRLSVFLSHPTYALGILLFTIIASAGIGSYISDFLPLTRSPWVFLCPITMVLAVVAIRYALPVLLAHMITAPMLNKIVASILVIAPLGLHMGIFFPTGMRLVRATGNTETPWYWALNGVFGVLCSALAVFFSIYSSVSTSFYIAAACYGALLVCLYPMSEASRQYAPGSQE